MRDRVFRDTSSSSSYQNYWRGISGCSTVRNNATKTYTSSSMYEAMRDVVTPDFKRKIAQGIVVNNPKYKITKQVSHKAGMMYSEGKPTATCLERYDFGVNFTWFDFPDFAPVYQGTSLDSLQETVFDAVMEGDNAMAVAISQSWANVDVSEAAALASLGELPETIRWFTSLLTRMIRTIRFFKSKKQRMKALKALNPTATVDSLSDLWLEFRYAIRPLVFEAKQAVEAMQAAIEVGSRQTARGWNRIHETETTTIENYYCSVAFDADIQRKSSLYSNYRAGVLYEIESDINGLMAIWGLDQSTEAIWELTPFSFIIDWFFNVGDIISSWSISPHLRPLCSWISRDVVYEVSFKLVGCHTHHSYLGNYTPPTVTDPGSYKHDFRTSIRYPNPRREVLPSLDLNLDWAKTLDLATIGRSLFRSLRA